MDDTDKMLTTSDNPYDPHEQYEQWLYFDTQQGYNTQSYVARVYSSKLSDPSSTELIDSVMKETFDEIIKTNPLGLEYQLV